MRCLVIGYGSIGARHARLLHGMGHEVIVASRQREIPFPVVTERYALRGSYDLVVIATPTGAHAEDYAFVANELDAARILLEKPAFSFPPEEWGGLLEKAKKTTYVGYNLRFHPVVEKALLALDGAPLYSLLAYVGQYLPDWRPGKDYRLCYSADKSKGGGVLRDLSHELDLACLFSGPWSGLVASGGHVSDLETNADDVFSLLACHERCPQVMIHLNCLDRAPQRFFVLNSAMGTLHGDMVRNTLTVNGVTEDVPSSVDASYEAQLRAMLNGDTRHACTFGEGLDVLRMIVAAEESARSMQWITR